MWAGLAIEACLFSLFPSQPFPGGGLFSDVSQPGHPIPLSLSEERVVAVAHAKKK
jgi:hypothetical protein